MTLKNLNILLVEDNPGDVRLITEMLSGNFGDISLSAEAIRELKSEGNVRVARDGIEALEFLQREGKFAQEPPPDLILLDLNLPKKNGHEVLWEIKTDAHLKSIPVIVFTSSDRREDLEKSYELQADGFARKPTNLEQCHKIVQYLEEVWAISINLRKDELT